jgi:hypothetical protein
MWIVLNQQEALYNPQPQLRTILMAEWQDFSIAAELHWSNNKLLLVL